MAAFGSPGDGAAVGAPAWGAAASARSARSRSRRAQAMTLTLPAPRRDFSRMISLLQTCAGLHLHPRIRPLPRRPRCGTRTRSCPASLTEHGRRQPRLVLLSLWRSRISSPFVLRLKRCRRSRPNSAASKPPRGASISNRVPSASPSMRSSARCSLPPRRLLNNPRPRRPSRITACPRRCLRHRRRRTPWVPTRLLDNSHPRLAPHGCCSNSCMRCSCISTSMFLARRRCRSCRRPGPCHSSSIPTSCRMPSEESTSTRSSSSVVAARPPKSPPWSVGEPPSLACLAVH